MNLQARRLRRKEVPEITNKQINRSSGDPKGEAKILQTILTLRMNRLPNSVPVKRVTRVIELFQKAQTLHESFRLFFKSHEEMVAFLSRSARKHAPEDPSSWHGYDFQGWPELQELNSDLRSTLLELNRCLSRYKSYPYVFQLDYPAPSLRFSNTFNWTDQAEFWEHTSIEMLRRHNGKWMDRVRRCRTCETWFFAVVEHQTHCSDRCRKKRAATSDEFKARRREYMRDYRRREKELEWQSKVNAKRQLRGR